MKIILKVLIVPLLMVCLSVSAQVKTNLNNEELIGNQGRFIKSYELKVDFQVPAKNIAELLQAEKLNSEKFKDEKPFQLAVAVPVDLDIAKQISWNYDSTFAYGKFTIKLDGALSSSINFDKFDLPQGTEMYIYNENGNMITGPITEKENNLNKIWGSWVYQGSWLVIEIKTPLLTLKKLVLHSNNIAYGYKEVYAKVNGFGTSGPCEINVLCPLGSGWEGERNSVALVLNDNGQDWCSGCMVMNTCNSNRPFFLTANHCFTGQNVTAWRFTFQAWSPTCSPSQNSNGVTYNGSTLRANYANSDFCLVELNNTPPTNSGINYAGWTRSSTPAQNATGIHHPHGDVMKISKSNSAVVRSGWSGPGNDHWQVFWSPQNNGNGQTVTAVTEGGSSGSPLFDQNHRVVGQLHGGPSVCGGSQLWDYYGSFDVSWTGGGTNSTRLSNWLDPSNSGAMTTNTTNVSALINPNLSLSITGNNSFCSGTSNYTVNGVPAGVNITWTSSNAYIGAVSPNGNPATVTKGGGYGNVTITATVGGSCFTNNIVSKTIAIGAPDTTNITFAQPAGQPCLSSSSPTRFVILNSGGTTTPIEVASAAANTIVAASLGGANTTVTVPNFWVSLSSGSSASIKVRLQNSCGWSDWKYLTIPPCSGSFSFSVYPNPATNTVTIQQKEETGATINEVSIFDQLGNLKKRSKYSASTKQAQMNIANLMTGVYFIEISSGQNKERQQLIIQK